MFINNSQSNKKSFPATNKKQTRIHLCLVKYSKSTAANVCREILRYFENNLQFHRLQCRSSHTTSLLKNNNFRNKVQLLLLKICIISCQVHQKRLTVNNNIYDTLLQRALAVASVQFGFEHRCRSQGNTSILQRKVFVMRVLIQSESPQPLNDRR